VSQTIGYARVSARDQNPQLQLDAFAAAGCDRLFVEKASGALRERPQLSAALEYARAGDVLVVWKLDRLGRSLPNTIELMTQLDARKIDIRVLTMPVDTTTTMGKALFYMAAIFAEIEREFILERAARLGDGPLRLEQRPRGRELLRGDRPRSAARLAARRARGETGGRPRAVTPEKLAAARALLETKRTIAQAAAAVGVGRSTLYRYLNVPQPSAGVDGGTEVSDTSFEMPEWLPEVGEPTHSRK
jgi:DNA invertase Pin-like site-specific DNA recombinase